METTDWIQAISTIFVALSSIATFVLALMINSRDYKFRQEVRDLFEAISITNLLNQYHYTGWDDRIQKFDEVYTGKTILFRKKGESNG